MITLPAGFRLKRQLILLLSLTAILGWYCTGDGISECLDRSLVRHFHYQPNRTELTSGTRRGGSSILYLRKGTCVKIGKDVICYARSMGHHTLFGFRNGYSYVNVNGHTYWKSKGECGTTLHINLGDMLIDEGATVTEELIVKALRRDGFLDLPQRQPPLRNLECRLFKAT